MLNPGMGRAFQSVSWAVFIRAFLLSVGSIDDPDVSAVSGRSLVLSLRQPGLGHIPCDTPKLFHDGDDPVLLNPNAKPGTAGLRDTALPLYPLDFGEFVVVEAVLEAPGSSQWPRCTRGKPRKHVNRATRPINVEIDVLRIVLPQQLLQSEKGIVETVI